MAFDGETFFPQSSTTQSLKGFVLGGLSLPFELLFVDRFTVHSPQ
jgi:hypothetical protein